MTTYSRICLSEVSGDEERRALQQFMIQSVSSLVVSETSLNTKYLSELFTELDENLPDMLRVFIGDVNRKVIEGRNNFYQWKERIIGENIASI